LALSVDYEGPANSRVREVPDQRTIRYYTTLGLIDRPAEMRGRTALYRPRHLWQLVAIKRLQARGLTLSEIQERLVGLTDAALRRLAKMPETETVASASGDSGPNRRTEAFWTARPTIVPESAEERDARERDPIAGVMGLAGSNAPPPLLQAVPLDEILLVLAPLRPMEDDDITAIRVAAAPLLKLLEARRLKRPRQERGSP
jgi:DNA-binding transcriptional MerR regulator